MVNGIWEERRREEVYSNGRPERKSRTARRLGGGGVSRGNNSSGPPPPGMDRSVLKDRSREESACEKSVALIRRPAQDREQP